MLDLVYMMPSTIPHNIMSVVYQNVLDVTLLLICLAGVYETCTQRPSHRQGLGLSIEGGGGVIFPAPPPPHTITLYALL